MTLAWSTTDAALTAALATAAQGDRASIVAARARVRELGAKYDAAVSSGELSPAAGSSLAAVTSAQGTSARAALVRAAQFAEGLPLVAAHRGTFYASTDGGPTGDGPPIATARVVLLYTPPSVVAGVPVPASWALGSPTDPGARGVVVESLLSGAEGNRVSVRLYRSAEGPRLEARFDGRVVRDLEPTWRDGVLSGEVFPLVRVRGTPYSGADLWSSFGAPIALAGGAGGADAAALARAELARGVVAALLNSDRLDTAARAALTLAAERLAALAAAVRTGAPVAGDAASGVERDLAGAMDDAARLLEYLA